jgi:GtrA-like protein
VLNRAITFRHADAPLIRAFLRYWVVASAGLAVNFAVYSVCVFLAPRFGIAVTPAMLPLFVARRGRCVDDRDLYRLPVLRLSSLKAGNLSSKPRRTV